MSLLDTLRLGVSIVDKVTKPLQAYVRFERYLSTDSYGTRTFAPAVSIKAIVDWKQQQLRTSTGELSVSRSSVIFLDINKLKVATAGEGVDNFDKITLPDGTTGPILDMTGFIDAGTGHPLATEIYLG